MVESTMPVTVICSVTKTASFLWSTVFFRCVLYICSIFAQVMTEEENDAKAVLKLLYQSLRALSKKTIPMTLISLISLILQFYPYNTLLKNHFSIF